MLYPTSYTNVVSGWRPSTSSGIRVQGHGALGKAESTPGVHIQGSPSGSYRLEHMKQTLSHLPKVVGPLDRMMGNSSQKSRIYLLDNYSFHLDPSLVEALHNSSWILVLRGGWITGDIQTNDTALHRPLKALSREKEEQLMYKKLREDRNKIPKPSRGDIMMMMTEAYNESPHRHSSPTGSVISWMEHRICMYHNHWGTWSERRCWLFAENCSSPSLHPLFGRLWTINKTWGGEKKGSWDKWCNVDSRGGRSGTIWWRWARYWSRNRGGTRNRWPGWGTGAGNRNARKYWGELGWSRRQNSSLGWGDWGDWGTHWQYSATSLGCSTEICWPVERRTIRAYI